MRRSPSPPLLVLSMMVCVLTVPMLAEANDHFAHGHDRFEAAASRTERAGRVLGRPDLPIGRVIDHGNRSASAAPLPPGLGGNLPPGHGGPRPGRGDAERPARPTMPPPRPPRNGHFCGADAAPLVGPAGSAGRSHIASLSLTGGDQPARAQLTYNWIGQRLTLVLRASHLAADSDWALAALADDGSAICLATARSTPGGAFRVIGSFELDSHLPTALDPFLPRDDDTLDATVMLLPADAIDCESGQILDADAGLIAADGLRFIDTDLIECP